MKFTICITHRCNLRCDYCYVGKTDATMDLGTAGAVVDWIFAHARKGESIDVGLFGGEPLLAFDLVRAVTNLVENHAQFDQERVTLTLVSNGTIFSSAIASFLREHDITYCLSFDGPPDVHDRFRRFANGRGSADLVETNAHAALAAFGCVPVNAVYRPETFRRLPETVAYLAGLGFRQIYLSPDFSARWTQTDAESLAAIYGEVADLYIDAHLRGEPLFVSLIDSKITVLLRGGYRPEERCQMGKAEFAFTPLGQIYPCERLIGCGTTDAHRIGNVTSGAEPAALATGLKQPECADCSLGDYCMNWCGCSNFFATGDYGRTGPLICASERAAIASAARAFQAVESKLGPTFTAHLTGQPSLLASGRF